MAGIRYYRKLEPVAQLVPTWTPKHFYHEGALVAVKTGDSDQLKNGTARLDYYIALWSHDPVDQSKYNDYRWEPYRRFYGRNVPDSEGLLRYSPKRGEDLGWFHFASSGPFDSEERNFPALRSKVYGIRESFDSDEGALQDIIDFAVAGAGTVNSLGAFYWARLGAIVNRNDSLELNKRILDLQDSDIVNAGIIIWDSEEQTYKTKVTILTVNGASASSTGNIPLSLVNTIRGTRDDRSTSTAGPGTIFIIEDDSEVALNGAGFVRRNDGLWSPLSTSDRDAKNLRYINTTGDALTGRVKLEYTPVDDEDAVPKSYVTVRRDDSDKQNVIKQYDVVDLNRGIDETPLNDYFIDRENFVLYWNGEDGVQPAHSTEESVFEKLISVTVDSVSDAFNDLLVFQTQNFSNKYYCKVSIKRNGVGVPFVPGQNCALTANKLTLVNANLNAFSLKILGSRIDNTGLYEVSIVYHNGDSSFATKQIGSSTWVVVNPPEFDYGSF